MEGHPPTLQALNAALEETVMHCLCIYFQECIKPVQIPRKPGGGSKIKIEADGSYVELQQVSTITAFGINV